MSDLWIGLLWIGVVPAICLWVLYKAVRHRRHPSRSMAWWSVFPALSTPLVTGLTGLVGAMAASALFGQSKLSVALVIGLSLGAWIGWWEMCVRWMSAPPEPDRQKRKTVLGWLRRPAQKLHQSTSEGTFPGPMRCGTEILREGRSFIMGYTDAQGEKWVEEYPSTETAGRVRPPTTQELGLWRQRDASTKPAGAAQLLLRSGGSVVKVIINPYVPWLALAIAFGSYLYISNYAPRGGIIWNAIHGQIGLTDACPADRFFTDDEVTRGGAVDFDDLIPRKHQLLPCGLIVPYRWIFTLCLFLAAINFGAAARKTTRRRLRDAAR